MTENINVPSARLLEWKVIATVTSEHQTMTAVTDTEPHALNFKLLSLWNHESGVSNLT
jgi:hypothetical protein